MKFCLIGPGMMSIPPIGWGAIEIIIWDYKEILEKLGHEVLLINTSNPNDIINFCNNYRPDVVHIQYEDYSYLSQYIECRTILLTSHYAYLDQPNKWGTYARIFEQTLNSNCYLFALSQKIADTYISYGYPKDRVRVVPNGVRTDKYSFSEECKRKEESIYLAKIDFRKRQHKFQSVEGIKFVGNIASNDFNPAINYLGEWNKDKLYSELTDFANLVLLSDGEAHPLVCLEGLSSGLGLVISDFATANLDISKEFITVISEEKIEDLDYINFHVKKNREISVSMRQQIREYSLGFDWLRIIEDIYLPNIKKLI